MIDINDRIQFSILIEDIRAEIKFYKEVDEFIPSLESSFFIKAAKRKAEIFLSELRREQIRTFLNKDFFVIPDESFNPVFDSNIKWVK